MATRPSQMAQKFIQFDGQGLPDNPVLNYREFRPGYYFFYGTLTNPQKLAEVLEIKHQPTLIPAKIIGYSCKHWGQYPALVDGPPDTVVSGMAFYVQTSEEKEKLKYYEGRTYELSPCVIEFQDGARRLGSTFKWVGNPAELSPSDLKDRQLQRLG